MNEKLDHNRISRLTGAKAQIRRALWNSLSGERPKIERTRELVTWTFFTQVNEADGDDEKVLEKRFIKRTDVRGKGEIKYGTREKERVQTSLFETREIRTLDTVAMGG